MTLTRAGPQGGHGMGSDWIQLTGARSLGPRAVIAKSRRAPAYGPPCDLEHVEFAFRRWDGPVGEWSEHFGKGRGQVHSLDGKAPSRSCSEVEVAKRLRRVRDQAFWFSAYNASAVPEIWRPWVRSLGIGPPNWLTSLDTSVRSLIATPRGGMPDVVAWNDADSLTSALFVECKGRREGFSQAQQDWMWAATQVGVNRSQLAVSVRPF